MRALSLAVVACAALAALLPACTAESPPWLEARVPDPEELDDGVQHADLPIGGMDGMVAFPGANGGKEPVRTFDLPLSPPSGEEAAAPPPASNDTEAQPAEGPVEESAREAPSAIEDVAPLQEDLPPSEPLSPSPPPPRPGLSEPEPDGRTPTLVQRGPATATWEAVAFPALALGLGLALLPRLRQWLPVPQFLHVDRERALAHAGRRSLLDAIARQAGSTLPELAAAAGMSRSNAAYHLSVLEWHGLLRSAGVGRRRHFVPAGAGDPRPLALLRHERRRRIAAYVLEHPDCLQRDICASLRIGPGRVHEQVRRLHEAGLVARTAAGRAVRLRATDALRGLGPLLAPATA